MARYEKFADIYQRAVDMKNGKEEVENRLAVLKSRDELASIPDHRWLAEFTRKVFQCGIQWRVVNNKWDNFEEVFWGFDIEKMLLMPDELWQEKAQDPRIIRYWPKVATIRENAFMINEVNQQGDFSEFIADYPTEDITALWRYLKKHGGRLGGNTGPYTLRYMGKDTFFLTHAVEAYLRNHKIIDGGRDTLRSHKAAQQAFNHWQQESGLSLSHISQIIAFGMP